MQFKTNLLHGAGPFLRTWKSLN